MMMRKCSLLLKKLLLVFFTTVMKIHQVPHKILATSLLGNKEEPWVEGNTKFRKGGLWVKENTKYRKGGLGGGKYRF